MRLVDSHCHLNYPQFEDIEAVIERAFASDVSCMQTICTRMGEFDAIHALATAHAPLYCSVGVHPHEVDKEPIVSAEILVEKTRLPKVIGIGETGLDYYYEHSDRQAQQHSFHQHIEAARTADVPVIVHTRDADEDTVRILQEEMARGAFRLLIHCFSSSRWLADAVLEMGGYLSMSGILTFPKATELRETVAALPLSRLLVETDAPYLAPVPHRGKPNEPAYTRHTAEMLATIHHTTLEEVAAITTANFYRLFDRVKPS